MPRQSKKSTKTVKEDQKPKQRTGLVSAPVSFLSYLDALDKEHIQHALRHLWESWSIVVGEELAAFATPIGHEKKALWIGCEDSVEAQEIYMQQREILQRVNAFLGKKVFTSLFVDQKKGKQGLDTPRERRPVSQERERPRENVTGSFLSGMDPTSPVAAAYARFVKKAAEKKTS